MTSSKHEPPCFSYIQTNLFQFFYLCIRVSIFACKNNCIQISVANKKQKWFVNVNFFRQGQGGTQSHQFDRRCGRSNSTIFSHFNSCSMFDFADFEGFIQDDPVKFSKIKGCINVQLKKQKIINGFSSTNAIVNSVFFNINIRISKG